MQELAVNILLTSCLFLVALFILEKAFGDDIHTDWIKVAFVCSAFISSAALFISLLVLVWI